MAVRTRAAAAERMAAHLQAMAAGTPELSPYASTTTAAAEQRARDENRNDRTVDRGLIQWWA